ncbi:MAG: copper chaperone PCu(A)C [Xanthobacteraceae bacterium]|nr:copper chaperone PCu(A)C [Xanthobacteraceae bacterium]
MKIRLAIALLICLAPAALADDYKAGDLQIVNPWSRATPQGARVAGGYLKITNEGRAPDRLLGGSTEVAERVEVHEMRMEKGVMTMREVKGGLALAPGASVELKPGSYHLMFMGLKRPLAKGERIKGSLQFERAGRVEVEFTVEAIGGPPAAHGH